MDESIKGDIWPARFPIARALIAFIVIPVLSNLLFFLVMGLLNLGTTWRYAATINLLYSQEIGQAVIYSILFFVPGGITFLCLGLPLLYILYRLNWGGFIVFAALGMLCTLLGWIVISDAAAGIHNWQGFEAFGVVGAVNGIVTRLIVLGCRWSWLN